MYLLKDMLMAPILINTEGLCGEIRIKGNIGQNYLQFQFYFHSQTIIPVIIRVSVGKRIYRYCCYIESDEKKMVQTPVFSPLYSICQPLEIVNVEPIVRMG